jgi:cell filamentation protein
LIEPDDLIIPGNLSIQNRLATDVPGGFDRAAAEAIFVRLSQLESRPVVGAYDATHLLQIHVRIFEDLFPWAGKLRESQSSDLRSSLDVLFDKLARENRLKGLDGDAWSERSTEYLRELIAIEPFPDGNEIASLEFLRELAGENDSNLIWKSTTYEQSTELQAQSQTVRNNSLRRILMLALDPYQSNRRPHWDMERDGRSAEYPFS